MKPILLDIPMPITTPRLIIRPPQPGDGLAINEAIIESFEFIKEWLPWAKSIPTVDESEESVRQRHAKWILREDLGLHLYDRETGVYVGGTGLHRMNWDIPKFEIGYWVRKSFEGKGLISEAANATIRFAFEQLNAKRVELRCDAQNERSIKVAKNLGFVQEGHFKDDSLTPDGQSLRDTVIFARHNIDGLADLEVSW